MGIVVQAGQINTNAVQAPNAIINILPPSQSAVNGVPTDIVGIIGTASWGPVNSPAIVGSMNEYLQQFGSVINRQYDMGTHVYTGTLNFANNFRCVRVTDGSDTIASVAILDTATSPALVGMFINAKYSGSLGNRLQVTVSKGSQTGTYKFILALPNQAPEIFDNIGGSGAQFWTNAINAINLGTSGQGPSTIAVAVANDGINGVDVTTAGSYTTVPGYLLLGPGSGADLQVVMKAVSLAVVTAQSGAGSYAPLDLINLSGGSSTQSLILKVTNTKVVAVSLVNAGTGGTDGAQTITGTTGTGTLFQADVTVTGGVIASIDSIAVDGDYTVNPTSLSNEVVTCTGGLTGAVVSLKMGVLDADIEQAGLYTALPANPVTQLTTGGAGTGATFNINWGVDSVNVLAGGSGYTGASSITFTSGTAAATLSVTQTINPPAQSIYLLSGGSDGADNISLVDMIGVDVSPRTGMYALRSTQASIAFLADVTDSASYSDQVSFGESEGVYMMLVGPSGQTPQQAAALIEATGVDNYDAKYLIGDWCYLVDPFNNVTRLVSPQGYVAGRLANLAPMNSSLNQQILGLVGTETSYAKRIYTSADIAFMAENGLDVIANPSPGGAYFATQTGQNTSSNPLSNDDGYTRLTNYLAYSLSAALGQYIGQLQTPSVRLSAKNTIQSFLQNLVQQQFIGDVNGGPAYQVILDASNNPSARVAQGYMQADVKVVDFRTIRVFLVNLQNGDVTLQNSSPNV